MLKKTTTDGDNTCLCINIKKQKMENLKKLTQTLLDGWAVK